MALNLKEIAEAFVKGNTKARSGASVSIVERLNGPDWFVSYNTVVAKREKDGTIITTTRKYSSTTSRHVSTVRNAAIKNGNPLREEDF